ncbi:MAG: RHS repeat-associated core domain-containing protein [Pirellulaceae bacterium]|nr:RHS repeat-associated core domain-containing protein [Pirellulaceae bacterium]
MTDNVTTTQTFSYNRQGLMASVITDTSDQTTLKRVDYSYDTGGHRVGSAEYQASSSSPSDWTLTASTRYLTDVQNPTGYSQVLQETHYSGGAPSKKIIYTVGHDQISQATFTIDTSGLQSLTSSLFFGTDGHGSVRVLYDAAAAIAQQAELQQIYQYDAYGNLLMIGQVSHLSTITPLTAYLYSGESFDFRTGQQYLRARWYDPRTGRFNQLDPFAGNSADPQSFHKYAYVHGDPVNGADPIGMFGVWGLLLGARNALAATGALYGMATIIEELTQEHTRKTSSGMGGADVTGQLERLLDKVGEVWATKSDAQKLQIFKNAHSLGGWDIVEMKDYQDSFIGHNEATRTLSYGRNVYLQTEVNYVLWGTINALAYRDRITYTHPLTGVRDGGIQSMGDSVALYRAVLGVWFSTRNQYDGTLAGRRAWAETGWNYVTHKFFMPPIETRLPLMEPQTGFATYRNPLRARIGDPDLPLDDPRNLLALAGVVR